MSGTCSGPAHGVLDGAGDVDSPRRAGRSRAEPPSPVRGPRRSGARRGAEAPAGVRYSRARTDSVRSARRGDARILPGHLRDPRPTARRRREHRRCRWTARPAPAGNRPPGPRAPGRVWMCSMRMEYQNRRSAGRLFASAGEGGRKAEAPGGQRRMVVPAAAASRQNPVPGLHRRSLYIRGLPCQVRHRIMPEEAARRMRHGLFQERPGDQRRSQGQDDPEPPDVPRRAGDRRGGEEAGPGGASTPSTSSGTTVRRRCPSKVEEAGGRVRRVPRREALPGGELLHLGPDLRPDRRRASGPATR